MLSIVVPVFDERESLKLLHAELSEVARAGALDVEFLFVDDGSTDGSWQVIEEIAGADRRVSGIRLRRNFGKAAALCAGFAVCRGERVMTLDADLQDNPHEIPAFLLALDRGLDVVSGWKQIRHDPWHKVWPSRVFNWMVSRLTGVQLHDHNCGMKAYRREVLDEIRLYGELHRFVPVLAAARGFRVGEVVVRHRPRRFGHSKYGVQRFVKGFLDLLTVRFLTLYGQRPQHLFGTLGLVCCGLGLLLALGGVLVPGLGGRTFLIALALLLFGGMLVALGCVAALVVAQRHNPGGDYSIAEVTAGNAQRGAAAVGTELDGQRGEPNGVRTASSRNA